MSSWNVVFRSEFGNDHTFTEVLEGIDEQDVLQKAEQAYCNATVESISRVHGEGFDVRSLYDNLKDVQVDVEEKSKQNYLDARGLFGSKLREMISTEDFLRLNLLMERQDRLVDRLFVAHVPSILEWTNHGTARYKSFSNFITSEYELKTLVENAPQNEVERQLIPIVNEICSIFDSVKELKEVSLAKIAKPFMGRSKKAAKKKVRPALENKCTVEAVLAKANLYICENCAKTFRSDQSACPDCKKSADLIVKEDAQAEPVIKGQEKLAKEVEVDCGGEIKDTGKEQGKVKEDVQNSYRVLLPKEKNVDAVIAKLEKCGAENIYANKIQQQTEVSFVLDPENFEGIDSIQNILKDIKKEIPYKIIKEQTEPTRKVIAKGITDKIEADRIASSKGGVVVSDEEDSKKFMVLVKEAREVPFYDESDNPSSGWRSPKDADKEQEYYDVQDVIDAECTLEPLKCRHCGNIGDVTFNQEIGDAYCEVCGTWQLSGIKEAKEYKKPEDFTKRKREVIEELAGIQRQIDKIKKKMEPLTKKKTEITPKVLEIIQEADTAGVRVDDVLMYIQKGRWQDPTYNQVLKAAQEKEMKEFIVQLEDIAKDLIKWQEASLKLKSESRLSEGIVQKAKALFKKIAGFMETLKKKGVKESVNEGVPEDHQKKIALKTLKMSDAGAKIMGGMTKEEARAFLKKIGFSDSRIAKLEEAKVWKLNQLDVEDLIQAQKLQKDLQKFGLHDNELMSELADTIKRKEQDVDRVKENKKKVNEALEEETFTAQVDLDLFVRPIGNYDVEKPKEVPITYRMDFEYRSWGLKDIAVSVVKPIDINYTLVEWGDEEDTRVEKQITISPSDITYEWDSDASILSPQNINITVTPDGKVTDAVVTFGYWTP